MFRGLVVNVVGTIAIVAIIPVLIFMYSDYVSSSDDLVLEVSSAEVSSNKEAFKSNYLVAEEDIVDSDSGGVSVSLGNGELITDTLKNPNGLPMYDGYTETGEYFDIDYSRFWNSGDEMNGLGDWTNTTAKNAVSREFSTDDLNSGAPGTKYLKKMSDAKVVGGYWTAEGRLCVALPPGAMIAPEVFEPLIDTVWTNVSLYTGSDGGTAKLGSVKGVFDNSLIGMHVDCVLEDGSVLALIVTDAKGLHTGVYKGVDLCKDNILKGYAHWRGFASTGALSYMSILEVGTSSAYRSQFDTDKNKALNLAGNKIVSFRCYPETKGRFQ